MDLIECRNLDLSDLAFLEEFAQFPLEHFKKPMLVEKTFEDQSGIVGSIFVNKTVELAAIFNKGSKRDAIKAMKQVFNILYPILHSMGYTDLHTFVNDPKFADILVQHFGFEYVVGRALVRRY